MVKTIGNTALLALVVVGICYSFIALAVFGGIVDAESVPFWPTTPVLCANEPEFDVNVYAAGIGVRIVVEGQYQASEIDAVMRAEGYRVEIDLIPSVPEHVATYLPTVEQVPPDEVLRAAVTPALDRALGGHEIVLGPGFDEGTWKLQVGCHTPDDEIPTYFGQSTADRVGG